MTAMSLEIIHLAPRKAAIGPFRLVNDPDRHEWTIYLRTTEMARVRNLVEAQEWVCGWQMEGKP